MDQRLFIYQYSSALNISNRNAKRQLLSNYACFLSPEMLKLVFFITYITMIFCVQLALILTSTILEPQDLHKKCRAILIREHMQPRNTTLAFQNDRPRLGILESK